DGAEHEGMQFLLAKALDHFEPGAPWLAVVDFDRAGDQHLADPAAAGGHDDRVILGAERDDRLVGLDHAAERLALGVDHGAAQLWRPTSRRFDTNPGSAGSAAAAPRCRWSASPSKTPPKTRSSAAACWHA